MVFILGTKLLNSLKETSLIPKGIQQVSLKVFERFNGPFDLLNIKEKVFFKRILNNLYLLNYN